MFDGVISSKTKASILVRLFLNPATRSYLRELASQFGVSTNSVRCELNTLTQHGILVSEREGRQVFYRANRDHPLFPELSSMVRKITGIESLVSSVLGRLGNLEAAYLVGDYAGGLDTGIIDVVLIGDVDGTHLEDITRKTERYIKRRIRSLVLSAEEFERFRAQGRFAEHLKLYEAPGSLASKPGRRRA